MKINWPTAVLTPVVESMLKALGPDADIVREPGKFAVKIEGKDWVTGEEVVPNEMWMVTYH